MFIYVKIITILIASVNGFLCFLKPSLTIKLQQRFYEKINWRIEPINLNKELRNTRIMGIISLIIATILLISLIKKW